MKRSSKRKPKLTRKELKLQEKLVKQRAKDRVGEQSIIDSIEQDQKNRLSQNDNDSNSKGDNSMLDMFRAKDYPKKIEGTFLQAHILARYILVCCTIF